MSQHIDTWRAGLPSPTRQDEVSPFRTEREAGNNSYERWFRMFRQAGSWLRKQNSLKRKNRRLRVSETVTLGDKRFVSLIEVDGHSFLIGGGAQGVSLLTTLPAVAAEASPATSPQGEEAIGGKPFDQVLGEAWKETA